MKQLALSDYQALAEFRYQIRKFLHFSDLAVEERGLERSQYQLMLAIKGIRPGGRPRIQELADRLLLRHHSAVELVDRLESRGYVFRERSREDRREVLVRLTSQGERVLEELARHHHVELTTAGPKLVTALQLLRMGSAERPRRAFSGQKHSGRSPKLASAKSSKRNLKNLKRRLS